MFEPRKTFKNRLIAVAVAGAATLMVAAPAQAYVMATSILNMQNFLLQGTFVDENDETVARTLDFADFSFLTYTTTADTAGSLTGFGNFSETGDSPSIEYPTTINLPYNCIGTGCATLGVTEDGFEEVSAPPGGNYAAADQFETGAPISGLEGFTTGADVQNATYVGIEDITAVASADANNNLNSSFIFALNQDEGITFSFDLSAYLQVAVTGDEAFPAFATAALSMEFTIVETLTQREVFSFSPQIFRDADGDPIGNTISLNAPLPFGVENIRTTDGFVSFSATSAPLTAGTLYQASFRMNTDADARRVQQIPEPATLALLGMGLMGLGLVARRRKHVG